MDETKMLGALLTRLHAWLKNNPSCEPTSDKITDEYVDELQCIVDGLISLKYKPDSNGNNPISFIIVDHTKSK